MLNLNQLTEKISNKGYRRNAHTRTMFDDNGNRITIYDFEHRKKLDMFTVYVKDTGEVKSVEFTKVNFDRETRKFSQNVIEITDTHKLLQYLA